jgi:hypothetical protein
MLVNPFVADTDCLGSAQPARNLLGAPIQAKLGFDRIPCFLNDANTPVFMTIEGFEMSLPGTIAPTATITMQLAAYGGFVATNHFGYLRLVMTYFQQGINLVSLSLGKLRVAHKHSFDLLVFRGLSYRSLPLLTIKVALVS